MVVDVDKSLQLAVNSITKRRRERERKHNKTTMEKINYPERNLYMRGQFCFLYVCKYLCRYMPCVC